MKRYLLGLILAVVMMVVSADLFAQVKLLDSGVTKFYDKGTRITYFEMSNFPNSQEMRDFVAKMVLENSDVMRAIIYKDGKTFMYEALQGVEPDMIVDAVNDALAEYNMLFGEFPESSQGNEPKKSNVTVRPHIESVSAANSSEKQGRNVAEEKKAVSESNGGSLNAVPVMEVQKASQPSNGAAKTNAETKNIENVMNK
ncbi:MAG: hypothetical protein J6T48_08735 [Bacteroidales bacterium]|nr:hypothetical protein [Bacteroidales bacterium]